MDLMGYQLFFKKDQDDYQHQAWRGAGPDFLPEPCLCIRIDHSLRSLSPELTEESLEDSSVFSWLQEVPPRTVYSRNSIFFTPPREVFHDKNGNIVVSNFAAAIPFSQDTFNRIVAIENFHKGFFRTEGIAELGRLELGDVTTFSVGNFSHRAYWFKCLISFEPKNLRTTVFLHNLLEPEQDFVRKRINDTDLHPLTIHPMFILVVMMELLSHEALNKLERTFGQAIGLKLVGGFETDERFHHLQDLNLDLKTAAEQALSLEQEVFFIQEKMSFAIKMGRKIISWLPALDSDHVPERHQERFRESNEIIRHRLEHLIDTIDLHLIRATRAQSHAQLNRLGLEARNTSLGNSLSYRISEQSRDIAKDSKSDSSAMKAIAVLTMFFLPGTFIAAFFAIPLFDWEAPTSSSVVKSRFWIYWAVTVPATIFVLGLWRMWYLLEEWRRSEYSENGTYKDFWLWLGSGSTSRKYRVSDLEKGD